MAELQAPGLLAQFGVDKEASGWLIGWALFPVTSVTSQSVHRHTDFSTVCLHSPLATA